MTTFLKSGLLKGLIGGLIGWGLGSLLSMALRAGLGKPAYAPAKKVS